MLPEATNKKSMNVFMPFRLPYPRFGYPGLNEVTDYATDFWQRSILFLDILRQRGNKQREMTSRPINAVLIYDYEVVMRGPDLPRPVNYWLVRVIPPEGVEVDDTKRPVVVIDPRAGQGPGIGGFKPVSQIGQTFEAGHPVYFIGFGADPVDGQTIEDIACAHTAFLEKVIELHPGTREKPFLIGNCQAGWHAIMAACMRPDLVGPIMIAGAPLSYWAGVRGENPMRYAGGLLGGTWLARLISDLGGGAFDGAWLISNFDNLNPANTLWTKQYEVWADPDKQADRYLHFESWWGAFIKLHGQELQYMVDNLFVGNKLSTGQLVTADGMRLDIRSIRTPILCFCSKADNITPPPQALDWILENYDSVDEIQRYGQTIVYCLHETAGHLAIFVGTKVAAKEHSQFINYMDLVDGLPPGLYEIVITDKQPGQPGSELLTGDYNVRIVARDLDDIRALGFNTPEDEREFQAVARVSEINNAFYTAFVQPWIKRLVTQRVAATTLAMHPLRLGYAAFSDQNPLMRLVATAARKARADRRPAHEDNVFLKTQEKISASMTKWLQFSGRLRDRTQEAIFHAIYGSPLVQTAVGVTRQTGTLRTKPGDLPFFRATLAAKIEELRSSMREGGSLEATVRALVYIAMGQEAVDARSFETLRRIMEAYPEVTLAHYKKTVRDQWGMLMIDEKAALESLPALLPPGAKQRRELLQKIKAIRTAAGPLEGEAQRRLDQIQEVFQFVRPGSRPRGTGRRGTRAKGSSGGHSRVA